MLFISLVASGLLQGLIAYSQPKVPVTPLAWGIKAYQQGYDALALRYFKQAWVPPSQLVGLKIVDPSPLVWQAKCYARLGDVSQASEAMKQATALAQPGSQAYAFATRALLELFPSNVSETTAPSSTFRQTLGEPLLMVHTSTIPENSTVAPHRWQHPIIVWVQPTMPAFLSPKQVQRLRVSSEEVEQLLHQWQPALPGSIPMVVTQDAILANVRIEWMDRVEPLSTAEGGFTSGLTQWQVANDGQLIGATLRIAIKSPSGQPRTKVALLQTTLHELGHALGLAEHSTQAGDIMAAHGVGSYHVSSHDLARLQALYASSDSAPTPTTLTVLP
ncbi:MAG: matrixin family metalloprotease [Vampirovibrionales bacterium]|nr:matrixin family metalloprotease [Vampirovibrionales bacterium]